MTNTNFHHSSPLINIAVYCFIKIYLFVFVAATALKCVLQQTIATITGCKG